MKTEIICLLCTACGSAEDKLSKAFQGTASGAVVATPVPGAALTGYVVSAFEVVVDGTAYPDIEAWFSATNADLVKIYKRAGHDMRGRTMRLKAQAGVSDFWAGIEVFALAVATDETGADGRVRPDGSFSIPLPSGADSAYDIRAIKRFEVEVWIGTFLEKTYCYQLNSVPDYAMPGNPIKIDAWTSTVTAYGCTPATTSGLSTPAK